MLARSGDRTLPEVVAQKAVDVVITVGDLHRSDIAGAERLSVPVEVSPS
jgi:hypothetical protein